MIGMELERDRLDQVLRSVRAGAHTLLRVEAVPGGGKTSLCDYARSEAERAGFLVVEVVGTEWEGRLQWAAVDLLLRQVSGAISTLPSSHRKTLEAILSGDGHMTADLLGVGSACLALLNAVAEAQPVLVTLDDAQWFDQSSLAAIAFASRRLRADPIGIIAASRLGAELPYFEPWPGLVIQPLNSAHAAQLAVAAGAEFGADVDTGVARSIGLQTGGNPLAIKETVRLLTTRQLAGDATLPDPLPLGRRSALDLGARMSGVPAGTRLGLTVVGLAGLGGSHHVPDALRQLQLEADVLDWALDRGILVMKRGELVFSHPLLRAAAVSTASSREQRLAHGALGLTIADDESRRAWHAADAVIGVSEEVAAALERVGHNSDSQRDPAAAAEAYDRAAGLTVPGEQRDRRRLAAGDAFARSGQLERCMTALDSLRLSANEDIRADALLVRAELEVWSSDPQLYEMFIDEARQIAERDRLRACKILLRVALLATTHGQIPISRAAIDEAFECLPPGGDQAVTRAARAMRSHLCALGGDTSAVPDEISATDAYVDGSEVARYAAIQALLWTENLDDAVRQCEELIVRTRSAGRLAPQAYLFGIWAEAYWWKGHLGAADAALLEATSIADESFQPHLVGYLAATRARIAATLGDRQAVALHLTQARQYANPVPVRLYIAHAAALDALGNGDLVAALQLLRESDSLCRQMNVQVYFAVPYLGDLGEAALLAGDTALFDRVMETLGDSALPSSRWRMGVTAKLRGMSVDDCDLYFDTATVELEAGGFQIELARANLARGQKLRRLGRKSEAKVSLEIAATQLAEVGAAPWYGQAARELRALGTRPPRLSATRDRLTPQELQVCAAAVQGATNREIAAALFLSQKTVEYHLTKAFRKLGVRSRAALTTAIEGQVSVP